jgi:hypothetical protein
VRRAGQVVTKTELLEEVWPDSFVEETGLTRNISVLRQALGPDAQQAIVTVARIGYRFDAPVRFERGAASAARTNGPPPRESAAAAPDARTPAARRARLVVGRVRELRALLSAFAEVESGAGRFIAVTGEAGIGKSTLVDEFVQMIRSARPSSAGAGARAVSQAPSRTCRCSKRCRNYRPPIRTRSPTCDASRPPGFPASRQVRRHRGAPQAIEMMKPMKNGRRDQRTRPNACSTS